MRECSRIVQFARIYQCIMSGSTDDAGNLFRNISNLTDIRAINTTLYSVATSFRLLGQCRDALSSLGCAFKVILFCVPGRRNIDWDKRDDRFVWRCSNLGNPSGGTVCVSLATVRRGIYLRYLAAADLVARVCGRRVQTHKTYIL